MARKTARKVIKVPKNFHDPEGTWEYRGAFEVHLTRGADKRVVKAFAKIEGNVVIIKSGVIKQSMGGIDMSSGGRDFRWGYDSMIAIYKVRGGNKKLLWVNINHKKMR